MEKNPLPEMISLLIADDHAILSEGLRETLGSVPGLQVAALAADGASVMRQLEALPVDVIIMDVNMPGMGGIECTRQVKARYPQIKVVILTMHSEKSVLEQVIQAGADGCLLKSGGMEELIAAIKRVMEGKSYFDGLRDFVKAGTEPARPGARLSTREVEIIRLIIKGLTSHEIAESLFIAENTVKTHRKNILRKLGLSGTHQLALYALSHQLTDT